MRKSTGLLLFGLLIFAAGACHGYEIPGFTKKAFGDVYDGFSDQHRNELILTSLKEKPEGANSYPMEVIYAHYYFHVKKDGSYVEYLDRAIKINAPFMKSRVGEPSFTFDSSKEQLEILKASAFTPQGKEIDTDLSEVKVKEPYTGLVYSDLKMKILTLKGVEDGSALRVAMRKTHNPVEDKGFIFEDICLSETMPSKEEVYVYRFEAGTSLKTLERFRDRIANLRTKEFSLENGDKVYVFAVTNAKVEEREPESIPSQEFFDNVYFYNPATWESVGQWYASLSEDKMKADKEISAKVAELTSGSKDPQEAARALYNFVRKIRYVSISLNEHSMIPHTAAETLRNLYGDCKDKATLLVTMLRSSGTNAYIALVNTHHLIEKAIPTPLVFNHAIVAIPTPDGTYKFLDPTAESVPYGSIPDYVQYRNALVVKEKTGELVLVPPDDPAATKSEETTRIEFKDLSIAKVTSDTLIRGKMELARLFNSLPEYQVKQAFAEALSQDYKQVQVDSVAVEGGGNEGEVRLKVTLTISDFTKRMGNMYAFHPFGGSTEALKYSSLVYPATRKTDIELGTRTMTSDRASFEVPDSTVVEFLPEDFHLKNAKFGEYKMEVTRAQNSITFRRSFDLLAKRIAAKDYPEFKEFMKECMDHEGQDVLLKKK